MTKPKPMFLIDKMKEVTKNEALFYIGSITSFYREIILYFYDDKLFIFDRKRGEKEEEQLVEIVVKEFQDYCTVVKVAKKNESYILRSFGKEDAEELQDKLLKLI